MSRENGPVKEISIDAILMKDGKYLPAFAKGSNAYWRNTDKSLAEDKGRNDSGPLYISRSRQSSESLNSARSKESNLPYSNR